MKKILTLKDIELAIELDRKYSLRQDFEYIAHEEGEVTMSWVREVAPVPYPTDVPRYCDCEDCAYGEDVAYAETLIAGKKRVEGKIMQSFASAVDEMRIGRYKVDPGLVRHLRRIRNSCSLLHRSMREKRRKGVRDEFLRWEKALNAEFPLEDLGHEPLPDDSDPAFECEESIIVRIEEDEFIEGPCNSNIVIQRRDLTKKAV